MKWIAFIPAVIACGICSAGEPRHDPCSTETYRFDSLRDADAQGEAFAGAMIKLDDRRTMAAWTRVS
jgi:hypothetical protein